MSAEIRFCVHFDYLAITETEKSNISIAADFPIRFVVFSHPSPVRHADVLPFLFGARRAAIEFFFKKPYRFLSIDRTRGPIIRCYPLYLERKK